MAINRVGIHGAGRDKLDHALRNLEAFQTGGSFRAEETSCAYTYGELNQTECAKLKADNGNLRYVVYSYATPIAWVTKDNRVYRVAQKFSVTTSRHQSVLYLLGGAR